ncbi:hypothetical protein VH569_34075 [Azospirillum sp. 11R-A]|uniref:hypothetical protein n=1 Tax=Azospirillum sp. 11R-A TaxID=3111634 RepID=UPI003C1A1B46
MSKFLDDIDRLLADSEDEEVGTVRPASKAGIATPASGAVSPRLIEAIAAASAAIARLDERIARSPEHLRRGWLERWHCVTAAASARLDGFLVDPSTFTSTRPMPSGAWATNTLRPRSGRWPWRAGPPADRHVTFIHPCA